MDLTIYSRYFAQRACGVTLCIRFGNNLPTLCGDSEFAKLYSKSVFVRVEAL